MEEIDDPIIAWMKREVVKPAWKRKADTLRDNKKIFGLHPLEWLKIKAIVATSSDIVQNADTGKQAAIRIKRDARLCSASWITIDHIHIAIMLAR